MQKKFSLLHLLEALVIAPGVVLPLVSVWFLPVVLLSMVSFCLLQARGRKRPARY